MFRAIEFLSRILGNFGLGVLAVTVLVKLAFLPIANRSYQSIAKMSSIQPKIKALKEQYADDKHKFNMEQMELYKREKINPLGGCIPMLLQIPVFFSLYKVLVVTIEMRQAPFFGWIKDLSAPDPTNVFNLFGLLPYDPTHVAFFGPYLALGVWPLLMGVTMWLQMKMNPEPTDEIQKTMFSLDAGDVHLHHGRLRLGTGHLLDLEQFAVDTPAMDHHEARRHKVRTVGQSAQDIRLGLNYGGAR